MSMKLALKSWGKAYSVYETGDLKADGTPEVIIKRVGWKVVLNTGVIVVMYFDEWFSVKRNGKSSGRLSCSDMVRRYGDLFCELVQTGMKLAMCE